VFAIVYLGLLSSAALWINIRLAPKHVETRPVGNQLLYVRAGLPYVVPNVMSTAATELDKTILLTTTGGTLTGQYTAAFRIMQAALLPVTALMLSAVPRLFRTQRHAHVLIGVSFAYAAVAATALWLVAPLVPAVFGQEFEETIGFLRALTLVLVAECLRQMIAAVLTTADLQRARNVIEGGATVAAVVGFLALIPVFSAWGAIITIGIVDLAFVMSAAWVLWRRMLS
jgi:O-antigen/teichoic acid export membrane protein